MFFLSRKISTAVNYTKHLDPADFLVSLSTIPERPKHLGTSLPVHTKMGALGPCTATTHRRVHHDERNQKGSIGSPS